ncbi:MAG: alpha/beta fold hydrolase [Marinibacterium sp.]
MKTINNPKFDHSVPWFWPMAYAMEAGAAGIDVFSENLKAIADVAKVAAPPPPAWATQNRVLLDMDTMFLRDFSDPGATGLPVLIDPPYAGHHSTIADYRPGQSLVGTLLASGLPRVLAMDWKAATPEMRDFDIDKYLAEINVVVDDLGGRVHLVGLCQGGWMSAMFAARFPHKVASLVLAGSPIDTDAGDGPLKKIAHTTPLSFYEEMVAAGDGRMLGQFMLTGWKNMHPGVNYLGKFIDLYAHATDEKYLKRTAAFESWYEHPIDLPGRFYLQAIELLFKKNLFWKGEFIGLGRKLGLQDITCPAYLLGGDADDITPPAQVFAAKKKLGTPKDQIVERTAPGGHIGLFMGSNTLKDVWPEIGAWIAEQET